MEEKKILIIFNYLACAINIIAVIVNAFMNRWCFVLMFIGNIILIIIAISRKDWAQTGMFVFYNIMNIIGFINWTKKQNIGGK